MEEGEFVLRHDVTEEKGGKFKQLKPSRIAVAGQLYVRTPLETTYIFFRALFGIL